MCELISMSFFLLVKWGHRSPYRVDLHDLQLLLHCTLADSVRTTVAQSHLTWFVVC